jgi:hypothetical protein
MIMIVGVKLRKVNTNLPHTRMRARIMKTQGNKGDAIEVEIGLTVKEPVKTSPEPQIHQPLGLVETGGGTHDFRRAQFKSWLKYRRYYY